MDRKRKRELRDLNLQVWAGAKDVYTAAASLDSSLKKNTAFIKRLRTGINTAGQTTLLNEIRSLSLEKYLSEIIAATAEGLSKLKTAGEIACGSEVVSALHQRFGPANFTKQLAWLLGRGLTAPDKAVVKSWTPEVREREERERLSRHRILLRVVTEFWLCGLLRGLDDVERPDEVAGRAKEPAAAKGSGANGMRRDFGYDNDPFPLEVLKELLGHDADHANLPLAVLFVKNFAWDVLGLRPPSDDSRKTVDGDGADEKLATTRADDDSPMIEPALRQRFINVLDRYLQSVKDHLIRDQKHLNSQSRRNAEAYVKSGEIFEDRQANFEKQTRAQEKLAANAHVLCDVLGSDMPDLSDKDATDAAATGSVGIVKTGDYLRGQGDGAGIWEDEEERRFYENVVDLKGRSTAIANRTVGAQVDAILLRLPDLQNKDMVDQVALDFCFLNSKASRNRLIKSIQEIPKGRTDLLPLYARLAATLGQYMPDVLLGLVSHLDDEFRSLQRRKSKDFLGQVRMINMRYLAELTKFGIVPEHVIFHCFKVSLDDFSRMNIEIIANLLENCGRYLLRNPETARRMSSFLETLGRKKSAQHLGQQERMLLENAMYYVDPPDRAAIQQKERTPTELFVRQLIYLDMTKRNYMKILKTIRKLHWEEKDVVVMLERIFSKPAKVKFSNIHLLAVLLGALYRYHQDFAIAVIDNLLEHITLGLEQNDFKFNQRRIAEVKYLGELYNYKMVDSTVIFDTLYRIVTFGHEGGTPAPAKTTPFDLPDDFFRIRLVCTILDTCGICFDRGSSKKKLDFFLTFFQYYVLTKDPLPLDLDFLVQDTFALVRPQWKIVSDLPEAAKLFGEAIASNYKQQQTTGRPADAADEADDSESDALDEEDGGADDPAAMHSSADEADAAAAAAAANEDEVADELPETDSDEEEQIVVTREEEQLDPEAEAEFDKEFDKMMAESLDSRKFERKTHFDVPLPMRKVQQRMPAAAAAAAAADEDEIDSGAETPPSNTMAFSLMTKKGNRPQTRTIELPSDSNFAVQMKSKQAAEREEQQRIKNLVLNYDLGDDSQHDGTALPDPILQRPLDKSACAKALNPRNRPLSTFPRRPRRKIGSSSTSKTAESE
ncbi:hypothetical protein DV737_g4900, partial [Chaetothyriales sp. CBS 132003]